MLSSSAAVAAKIYGRRGTRYGATAQMRRAHAPFRTDGLSVGLGI